MSVLVGVLAALLSFGFIVFIHEMGHFLAARWAGIRCPYFAIGFGPRLVAFMHKGTEFSIRLFPLGGYVLMVGEDPGVDSGDSWHSLFTSTVGEVQFPTTPAQVLAQVAEDAHPSVVDFLRSLPPNRVVHNMGDLEGNFNYKSTLQKTVVILGGVFNNFVCALLLFLLLGFTKGLGVVVPVSLPQVGEVLPNTPAARVGMQKNDTLVALDGTPVVSGDDFRQLISERAGQNVQLTLRNGKQERQVTIVPELALATGHYFQTVNGEVQLVHVGSEVAVPKRIQLPFKVHTANRTPVSSLAELRKIASSTPRLELAGPAGQWVIQPKPGAQFEPRGLTGISLVQVTSFAFEPKATSEVIEVRPGSLAARAGVQKGDLLFSLQGRLVVGGLSQLEDVLGWLSRRQVDEGQSLKLEVKRKDDFMTLQLTETPPRSAAEFGVTLRPITPSLVVSTTLDWMGRILGIPLEIARSMVVNLFGTFKELGRSSTGPLGIMQQIFEVSQAGLAELLFLVAILNAFIATFNLLPIPALDGSRILFIWIGALRGRALDPEKEARVHFLGIVLLLGIAVLVSIQDIQRIWSGTPLIK